ncbi:MAG TPA: hypothetical protein VFG14_14650, partial [Chthoniobacteraceae bacterium]|nr:hypothetical protein [Chthoniobacteraceae bacterium]
SDSDRDGVALVSAMRFHNALESGPGAEVAAFNFMKGHVGFSRLADQIGSGFFVVRYGERSAYRYTLSSLL